MVVAGRSMSAGRHSTPYASPSGRVSACRRSAGLDFLAGRPVPLLLGSLLVLLVLLLLPLVLLLLVLGSSLLLVPLFPAFRMCLSPSAPAGCATANARATAAPRLRRMSGLVNVSV
jgi:hypothetical protein